MTMTTRSHSSRMHTASLPTIHVLVSTTCQYWWGAEMNKFEEVSSDGHKMPLAGAWGRGPHVPCLEEDGWGELYSEVQCIMVNGHMGIPPPNRMTDRQFMIT